MVFNCSIGGLGALLLATGGIGFVSAGSLHAVQARTHVSLGAGRSLREAQRALGLETPAQYSAWATGSTTAGLGPGDVSGLAATALSSLARRVAADRYASTQVSAIVRLQRQYQAEASVYLPSSNGTQPSTDATAINRKLTPLYLALSSRLNSLTARQEGITSTDLSDLNHIVAVMRLEAAIVVPLALLLIAVLALSHLTLRRNLEIGMRDEIERLGRDAHTDPITGLGNERAFITELTREVGRALRHKSAVALALIDVDNFDALNYRHGRGYGDQLLLDLAAFIGGRRPEDRTFRLNGGQFGLILPYATAREVYPLMEQLREAAEMSTYRCTLSIGIADLFLDQDTVEALRHRAEAALSETRIRGQNAVVAFATRARAENVRRPA